MKPIVYLNGQFLIEEHACIPITDRGFLFGDGVFTTVKVNEGIPEFLTRHLKKLEKDGETLGIVSEKISEEIIQDLVEKNHAKEGKWRLKILISGGNSPELDLKTRQAGQLLITLKPYNDPIMPCRLISYPYPIDHSFNDIKSLSMLDRLAIAHYALKHGFEDGLVKNHQGIVLETSCANLFWRLENHLFYPDFSLPLYQGITLQVVIDLCNNWGWQTQPVKSQLEDVPHDAQLYLCNSLKGIVPITAVDSRMFNRDSLFEKKIEEAYTQSIHSTD